MVISDATLRLVAGRFVTEDLGTPALKGVTESIQVYSVVAPSGVRHRLDVAPSRLTPLVGRDAELGLLADRWEEARTGRGQAVLIRGEGGVGKSRLLRALRNRLDIGVHYRIRATNTLHNLVYPFYLAEGAPE